MMLCGWGRSRSMPSSTCCWSANLNLWNGTSDNHLRHSRFIALRDDKKPKSVVREG
jgi:hypothetical protein